METNKSLHEIVRQMEKDDLTGNTVISKYVNIGQREHLDKIDAYINSKHTSGEKDAKNRDKPFFNIVTAAVNIWYRATDIDRKHIRIRSNKKIHVILAFIATLLLKKWMRKLFFGKFLNLWGRTLAKYGSAIVKFVEKNGELICKVMSWNNMIVDPVDFENNVKVEKLWLTPAQLKERKEYDQEIVDKLLANLEVRETPEGQKKDTKSEYIELYEVHGYLPLVYITGNEEDADEYQQQMHVVTYHVKKDKPANSDIPEYDDYTLYMGREAKDPYMITHLIEEDGRTLAIGAVEHLFQAQWMINHSMKAMKDQLDLASKLIFQTADSTFIGQNVLSAIETGDILIHQPNMPLTKIANDAYDIASLQNFASQWKMLADEITGVSESMKGLNPPSGTAWRQTEALLQESHSLFEVMTENKGLAIEEMMRKYIIPYIKKQMDTTEEIAEILDEHQIKQLDAMYVPNEAARRVNQKVIDELLSKTREDVFNGNLPSNEGIQNDLVAQQQSIQSALNLLGNQRFIKPSDIDSRTWKKVLEDFEWEVDVDVTNESKDRQLILTTLSTMLSVIAQSIDPNTGKSMLFQDENTKMIINKILEATGALSPVELNAPKL